MLWQSTRQSLLLRMRGPLDHPAWREFDRRYGELIVRYCRGCGLQLSDAEDVRQTVLMNLAKSLPSFDYRPERGRFRDYLRRATRNAIARHWRMRERFGQCGLATGEPSADGAEHEREWEAAWVQHHYRLALQTLRQTSEAKSLQIFERFLQGDSVEEVAADFFMTSDAVRRVRERIRDRLRKLIAAQVRAEDELYGCVEPA